MKVLTAEQIRSCDQFTISHEPISSIQLMERASQACADWISENCKNHRKVAVFCGNGNNGGDGFAIARMLYLKGFDVDVFVDNLTMKFSDNATINYKRLKAISGISLKEFKEIDQYHFDSKLLIIDALFGTGFSRPLEGTYERVVNKINSKNNTKISIDLPSGLFADRISQANAVILKSDYTLSFQCWKKSFLHPETGRYAGKVIILDINLSREYILDTKTNNFVIDEEVVKDIFKPRPDFSHKGTYGKAIIVGGSFGKIGAAVLSTRSALKTGAGLVFTLAPKCSYDILQVSCPEAMFIEGGIEHIENFEIDHEMACGIGPGLGTHLETEKALLEFLKNYSKPLVLDADALNILSKDKMSLQLIPQKSIITPHPKEFARLFGSTADSFERLALAIKKAAEFGIYIVLKDHHTQVITPEENVFYNVTGNSGLAKGGSGDILTGILTSFLAQGYPEEDSCILAVWLHGRAADSAAEKYSKEAMLPTDGVNEFGSVFDELNQWTIRKL